MTSEVDSNPFRPDGELSREAELLLKHSTIQRDKVIINDPAIRPVNGLALSPDGSVSPAGDVCGTAENHLSPTKASGVCASDNNSSQIRTGEVKSGQVPADVGDAGEPLHQVEHVKIKSGRAKCCSLL